MHSNTKRSLFRTDKRYLGLAPEIAREGDIIAISNDSLIPCVIRPAEGRDGKYEMIGESYVHGVISNQGLERKFLDEIDTTLV